MSKGYVKVPSELLFGGNKMQMLDMMLCEYSFMIYEASILMVVQRSY
jgi:hypothetical protein